MSARPLPLALRSRSFRADRIAWVVFLAVLLGATVATRVWLHRRVRDPGAAAPLATSVDVRLPVLAYERVGTEGRGLSPARLAEHLEALHAAGFHPVSLAQVRDAYAGRAPLPEGAILLTFDGGHLSTYEGADPLLRRFGWPAVMFVDPRLQERRHATYVYWDRLQRMLDSGLWDVGTVGPWPGAAETIARNLGGYRVLASARGSAGADEGARGGPALRFENAWFGVNAPGADPAHLARVRVPAGWSGRELVDRLRASLAAPALLPSGAPPPVDAARWGATLGRLDVEGDVAVLTGGPRAEAWLAGSAWARDFVLEAEVRIERGAFWVVQQAVASRDAWRWGGNERGLYLQRVQPGTRIDVLARSDVRSRPGAWHSLRVVKRGDGVWVEWDGAPVDGVPRAVGAPWHGYVGFATGAPGAPGRVSVRLVRFAAIPYAVRAVSASPSGREVDALLADAPRLAGVSPPGLVQRGRTLARLPVDTRLLTMLAARGAWDVVPTVELKGAAAASRAAELADVAAREGWAGLRVVVRDLAPGALAAWRDAAPSWRRLFDRRGLRLVLELGARGSR